MSVLSLVKNLSLLKEEQRFFDEILLEPSGIALTRGTLTEITGAPSSGKTSLCLSLLSRLTRSGEICAVVDSANSFDPHSAALAGLTLENLLWIKCGGDIEKAFMAADYVVQAKGFGAIWLNLNGIPKRQLKLVPRTYWYRYRTRIKDTPTMFLVTAEEPLAGSASQESLLFSRRRAEWSRGGRFKLLRKLHGSFYSAKQFYPPVETKARFDYGDV